MGVAVCVSVYVWAVYWLVCWHLFGGLCVCVCMQLLTRACGSLACMHKYPHTPLPLPPPTFSHISPDQACVCVQRGGFSTACLTVRAGVAATYSRNDMVLLARDDPTVCVGGCVSVGGRGGVAYVRTSVCVGVCANVRM